jgi:hypothetical protein
MTWKALSVALLTLLFLGGCAALSPSAANPEIRVANRSQTNFTSVRVGFPSGDVEYGPLAAGAASAYESVERAYRYAFVEVMIGDRRLVMQPIDYVGETPLGGGRYTYAIGLSEGGDRLTLELETD